jgi:hypothetical protein
LVISTVMPIVSVAVAISMRIVLTGQPPLPQTLIAGAITTVVVSASAPVEERSVILYHPPFNSLLEVPIRTVVMAAKVVIVPGRPIGKMLAEMSLVIEPGRWPFVADG